MPGGGTNETFWRLGGSLTRLCFLGARGGGRTAPPSLLSASCGRVLAVASVAIDCQNRTISPHPSQFLVINRRRIHAQDPLFVGNFWCFRPYFAGKVETGAQSQRDSVSKPRVAGRELPWVGREMEHQAQPGCVRRPTGSCRNPVGVDCYRTHIPRVARDSLAGLEDTIPLGLHTRTIEPSSFPTHFQVAGKALLEKAHAGAKASLLLAPTLRALAAPGNIRLTRRALALPPHSWASRWRPRPSLRNIHFEPRSFRGP
jgi:hypothetical protein